MYAVSEAYLEKIASRSVQVNWYGSIKTTIGTVYPFDLSTIVEGSGKITREICPQNDIEIGTTCSAELDISLILSNVDRYELYKGTITLYFQLKLGNGTWETVPAGVFIIAEPPERTQDVVTIHAYDAMLNFNKDFGVTLTGTPYYLLNYACNACQVELGSTQEEIANLTNGTIETYTYQEVEIYTYRDFVGYIASYLCCFAYIGVDGKLYLKPYTVDAVRDIAPSWRFEYKPQDYEAFYSAISAYFAVAEETETITLNPQGLTYEMGINPLIQFNADDVRKSVLTNIINSLAAVRYTPFTATVPCDPALMVGDVLNFTGNHAVDGKLSAITKQVITINGGMELECAGSDPNLNVLTAQEKAIQTAARNSNKDGMYYYDYANAQVITIADGESVQIILFTYTTTKETHVDFHAEVKCYVDTTEEYDEEADTYTERDGILHVTYRSGGVEVTEHYPVDTFLDGDHLLHLLWSWWASANIMSDFEVWIRCEGCSLVIEQGAAHAYIAGVGLVGDGGWDGAVHVYDTFLPIDFGTIYKSYDSEVEFDQGTPELPDTEDNFIRKDFFSMMFKSFTVGVNGFGLLKFSAPYDGNIMTFENVVREGDVWVVEDGTGTGIVTSPTRACSHILQATSKNSGNDVFFIVSFDGGDTWWTYSDGWHEPDYTQDVYGMFASTMSEISEEAWAEKFDGTFRIKAIMVGSAVLTDIQIYMEEYQ